VQIQSAVACADHVVCGILLEAAAAAAAAQQQQQQQKQQQHAHQGCVFKAALTEAAADTCETPEQRSNNLTKHKSLDDAVAITAEKYAHIRPRPHS